MINTNKFEITERSLLSKCAGYTQYFLSDVYTNSTQTKKAQVETVQSGRSMIEMLGVLAIVGVLSVGGIAGYSKAMEKFKINKTADQISQIVTNIRTLYAQQTTYYGLTGQTAYQMGVIPDELGSYSDSRDYYRYPFAHAFGGELYIDGAYENKAFVVSLENIPKKVCIALSTMDWGSPHSSGFVAIAIGHQHSRYQFQNNTQANTACNTTTGCGANYLPLPVATAADYCNNYCNDDSCTIDWKFQ